MRRLLISFILLAAPLVSPGQWKVVAPNLLGASQSFDGAMCFRDGIIWAGVDQLWSSADTGKTWTKIPFTRSGIRDIYFHDRVNGLVATGNYGAFLTRNGGQTWEPIGFGEIAQVAFGATPDVIHFLQHSPSMLYMSTDGALSFTGADFGGSATAFCISPDGTIRVIGYTPTTCLMSESTDGGATWLKDLASPDPDCWSIAADSCDSKRLYRMNEDWAWTLDSLSEVLLSTDGGRSWSAVSQTRIIPSKHFAGGLVTTDRAIFATTVDNHGVWRSTDRGITWENILGPSAGRDTRNICAVDENTAFVIDEQGSIWGFASTRSRETLFSSDTLTPCDIIRDQTVVRSSAGCSRFAILSAQVIGSTAYTIDAIHSDSVQLHFSYTPPGEPKNGMLILTFANGERDTISLMGVTAASGEQITVATQDQQTDTIGGMIRVPIDLGALSTSRDVELVLHYEPIELLTYEGSFDANSGLQVDIAGAISPGRSKLRLTTVLNGGVEAYASFIAFADSSVIRPKVWFDSVIVLNATPCEFGAPPVATSFISIPEGCGISALSRFVRTGKFDFSVYPNPATHTITITSSTQVDPASLVIYDALGNRVVSDTRTLSTREAISVDTQQLPTGLYFIQISGSGLSSAQSFTIQR